MWLLIVALILLFLVYILYHLFIHDPRPDKSVPMPYNNYPLLGTLPNILWQGVDELIPGAIADGLKWPSYYENIVGIELLYTDLESIGLVLNDTETFGFPPFRMQIFGPLFGKGIFLSEGDSWKIQRELARPIFALQMRKQMYEVYYRCGLNLVRYLKEQSLQGKIVETQKIFKRFTLDTFSEIGFGYPLNTILEPVKFADDFDWLIIETDHQIFNPLLVYIHHFAYNRRLKSVENFVYKIIEEREKEQDFNGKADYLSTLLLLKKEGNESITQRFLRDQLMNFFIAGRDTTAVLITWAWYYLSKHPEVEKKMRDEILEQLGSEMPSIDNTKNLKYTDMVLNETLRLTPPAVPFNSKMANKDITLPNGVKLSKGNVLTYSPYVIHRLPQYWGPDATKFRPERWEDPNLIKHPYQFIPFQKGPRICLGMNMAYEEAKSCLCLLVQNGIHFDFMGQREPKLFPSPVVSTIGGMNMKISII